jgi:hypothetical protein
MKTASRKLIVDNPRLLYCSPSQAEAARCAALAHFFIVADTSVVTKYGHLTTSSQRSNWPQQ